MAMDSTDTFSDLTIGVLALQGASEVIKRIAALKGYVVIDAKYERPTQ